jgi:hypothetical protein
MAWHVALYVKCVGRLWVNSDDFFSVLKLAYMAEAEKNVNLGHVFVLPYLDKMTLNRDPLRSLSKY